MLRANSPTDQRAGTRPISFILDNMGSVSAPVYLVVRPEDLTRTESTRAAVHQTLGRETNGWVDFFGAGLPSVTIAGHTGWRRLSPGGLDGMASFEALNQLVQHDFVAAKQNAIDAGADPRKVKLIFVDLLDNFTWSVVPTQFILRRSRSRPLLYQYNISLQAVDTSIDSLPVLFPSIGSIPSGLAGLAAAVAKIESFAGNIVGWVNSAVSYAQSGISNVAAHVSAFVGLTNRVLHSAMSVIGSIEQGATTLANDVIGIARDISSVGVNLFRTLSGIVNLPSHLKAELGRVASAYNEVLCIFRNALRPRKIYDDYDDLYGASNCSSTTGGRPISRYTNANPFALMQPSNSPIVLDSSAMSSIEAIKRSDPVLAPMPVSELHRHMADINNGVMLVDLTEAA